MAFALCLSACGGDGPGTGVNAYPSAQAPLLNITAKTRAPKQWMVFCSHYARACRTEAPAVIPLTPQTWSLLVSINNQVNQKLDYVDDSDTTGRVDSWDLLAIDNAVVTGDCEDAALTKKELLIARGMPAGAMRLALVQRPYHKGRGVQLDHAVLVVETSNGSFMLDSLDYRVKSVGDTDYRFLKVSAPTLTDPHGWAWVHGAQQTKASPH